MGIQTRLHVCSRAQGLLGLVRVLWHFLLILEGCTLLAHWGACKSCAAWCLIACAQVVLVSATLPHEVLEMTHKFMTEPLRVLVKRDELTLEARPAALQGF